MNDQSPVGERNARKLAIVGLHTAINRAAPWPCPEYGGSSDVPTGLWNPAAVTEHDPSEALLLPPVAMQHYCDGDREAGSLAATSASMGQAD